MLVLFLGCNNDDATVTSSTVESGQGFELQQNYPNPFNGSTAITFRIPEPAIVTINVYNSAGESVATLLEQELLDDGVYEIEYATYGLASGVYKYRIFAQTILGPSSSSPSLTYKATKKMTIVY